MRAAGEEMRGRGYRGERASEREKKKRGREEEVRE
jgi:hypothetical protein